MSHQQNSSLKKEKYMNDLYCMSSTCMLLIMMEKSRNSVCPSKKKIRAEGFAEKKILHKQWAGKNSGKVKIPPYPITFLKKWFWGWAIFLSNTIFAINLLPVSFAWIALHYIFCPLFLCAGVFSAIAHHHHPPPPISSTIGNLASSRVKSDCVTYK